MDDFEAIHEAAIARADARRAANGATPNGAADTLLRLVGFDDMHPRLGDGYLIKGLLGTGSMAVLYGESGSGKTFLALHLALGVAAGYEVFERRVRQAGVVYVAAESGQGIENRVAAAKHEIEFPETMPFAAIETPIDLCRDTVDLDKLISTIQSAGIGMPVELIVIDTLSRVMAGGNENQPDDMGAFVSNIDWLRAETGAAVLIVHHTGKELSRGARGHSILRAAVDTEIEIAMDEATKIATARVTKQRELPTEGTLSFSLHSIELGLDSDGDPIASCVVEEEEAAPAAAKARRLSPAQGRTLELLAEAINRDGEIPPASSHIPPSTRCVPEALWREYFYRGAISAGGQDAARKAFKRAAEALVGDCVGCWAGWVWLAG